MKIKFDKPIDCPNIQKGLYIKNEGEKSVWLESWYCVHLDNLHACCGPKEFSIFCPYQSKEQ